jgi:hypothetical protein
MQQVEGAGSTDTINSSGEMVGKTIRDLRAMCQLFYPEEEMMKGPGLLRLMKEEINTQFPSAMCTLPQAELKPASTNDEKGLIIFGILLEILSSIKAQQKGELISVEVTLTGNKIILLITWSGEMIGKGAITKNKEAPDLTIFEKAKLLGGNLQAKTTTSGNRRITLAIPIN